MGYPSIGQFYRRGVIMNRRRFLKTGAIAAALVTAGRLPLLSAQTNADASIDASTGPHAVKPIRDYLKRFSPAERPLRNNETYSLTYDIIHWNWVNGRPGTFANSVLGARTNRTTMGIDIASAIAGRVPEFGLLLKENRAGNVLVKMEFQPQNLYQLCS